MQYFAQDEATRLDPALTVYETLSAGSPHTMVPAIRNILGGFLFSGDDVYKKAAVLSGGERTRLAVARMLLRPSNTLLLDEPTNHLDIDSKEVLLDALADYGGTLIFVSHDRYFVERLATKIVEVGHGQGRALSRHLRSVSVEQGPECQGCQGAGCRVRPGAKRPVGAKSAKRADGCQSAAPPAQPAQAHDDRKKVGAEKRRRERAFKALKDRVAELETRIADKERAIKDVEQEMSAPGLLRRPRKVEARPRPAPGADVGGRRAARPSGRCFRPRRKGSPTYDLRSLLTILLVHPPVG